MDRLDPKYMYEELKDYPAFRKWLDYTNPDWQMEYSHILDLLEAWNAGYDAALMGSRR